MHLLRRLGFAIAIVVVTPFAVVAGIVRAVRAAPHEFVRDYPNGPIRGLWDRARADPRPSLPSRLLSMAPERLYPIFALAAAASWGVVLFFAGVMVGAWPRGVALALTACIVVIGAGAAVGLYQLAIERSRRDLSIAAGLWPLPDRIFAFGLAVVIPTVMFAAVATMLVRYDVLAVEGASAADDDLAFQAFATYLWYLADAVPVLKVPETLNWEPAMRFPTWFGGSLALLYKLVLILPAAQLLTYALARVWGTGRAAASD